jgi:DNA-binding XRE family transcriptional regulator
MNAAHYNPEILASARKAKFTQKEIAEKLNVTEMTIHRVETGQAASFELLSDMCSHLGLDVKDILNSTPEKKICAVT